MNMNFTFVRIRGKLQVTFPMTSTTQNQFVQAKMSQRIEGMEVLAGKITSTRYLILPKEKGMHQQLLHLYILIIHCIVTSIQSLKHNYDLKFSNAETTISLVHKLKHNIILNKQHMMHLKTITTKPKRQKKKTFSTCWVGALHSK